jgi:transcriptional regulator with XRE-family HTH domain
MDLRDVFAANLRRLRHAKGLSQDDLAYEAEISRSYLSQIEKGAFYASLKIVGKIAKTLGVEPSCSGCRRDGPHDANKASGTSIRLTYNPPPGRPQVVSFLSASAGAIIAGRDDEIVDSEQAVRLQKAMPHDRDARAGGRALGALF